MALFFSPLCALSPGPMNHVSSENPPGLRVEPFSRGFHEFGWVPGTSLKGPSLAAATRGGGLPRKGR